MECSCPINILDFHVQTKCVMYLIIDKDNQLANRLFVYAHSIATAIELNTSVINLGFPEYAAMFPTITSDLWCRYPQRTKTSKPVSRISRERAWRLMRRLVRSMEAGMLRIPTQHYVESGRSGYETTVGKSNDQAVAIEYRLDTPEFRRLSESHPLIILHGPLIRAHTYTPKHAESIRHFFRPMESTEAKIRHFMQGIRSSGDVIVGVHIRRGDYANFLGGRYFYSLDEYNMVMGGVERLQPGKRIAFLVCSNERIPQDAFAGHEVKMGTGVIIEDLYSLAACDYIIGPPSTFSNWASFYGKVPIYTIRDLVKIPGTHDFSVIEG